MSKNNGGPAFPFSALAPDSEMQALTSTIYKDNEGMTLRDYFAAKAMQAIIIGNGAHINALGRGAALDAYQAADLLLAVRDE